MEYGQYMGLWIIGLASPSQGTKVIVPANNYFGDTNFTVVCGMIIKLGATLSNLDGLCGIDSLIRIQSELRND